MKLTPIGKNIIVIRDDQVGSKTKSGIIMPIKGHDRSPVGKVIALSEEVDSRIKVGLSVLIKRHAGEGVKYTDIEYLLIKEDDVIGILEE